MAFGRSQEISSDPIISSTPPRPSTSTYNAYDSQDDSGDDLFNEPTETIPTLPLQRHLIPNTTHESIKAPGHDRNAQYQTQPTQILDTPIANRRSTTPVQASHVQVIASSSPSYVPSPPPQRITNLMAPPGTAFRAPVPTNSKAAAGRKSYSQVDLDDLPDGGSSDDDDEAVLSRADIKPTTFTTGGRPEGFGPAFRQKFGFTASPFIPQKRPVDDMASAYGSATRQAKLPRQNGPAAAIPIVIDDQDELSAPTPHKSMQISDIKDFDIRLTVKRIQSIFPIVPIKTIFNAVTLKKNNYSDAMEYLVELEADAPVDLTLSDDELQKTPQVKRPMPTVSSRRDVTNVKSIQQKWSSTQSGSRPLQAKREPQAPTRTIQDKWSNAQNSQRKLSQPITLGKLASEQEEVAKPRRRLVQGRRHVTPPAETKTALPSRLKPKKKIIIESDDEEIDSGLATDTASEPEASEPEDDGSLLSFINSCSSKDLADLANTTEEIAEFVISRRPFRSLDQIRAVSNATEPTTTVKKRGAKKPKPIGEKILDVCEEMWSGYEAVDALVRECEALGKPLAAEMKRWGFDVFGASKEGELGLVSLDDVKSERDSGIGTPSSSNGDDDVVEIKRSKNTFLKQPSIMSKSLVMKDYQLVGLNWLNLLWSKKLSCILADDMGLGKTCQVISFLSHLVETGTRGPHLVVVPGSTLENWLRELQNFSPDLNVEPYYGSQAEREQQRYNIEDMIGTVNVIVTTYDTAWRPADNKFLRQIVRPIACVFDEGHMLKNSMAKKHKELMRIKAEFRLLLTGTPLQNNLQELASLLAFIMPDLFEARKEDLEYIFKHKAKTTDSDHAALLSEQRIAKARSMMTPFILRRKKHQVLKHLPPKTCRVEYCTMTDAQKELYQEHLDAQRKVFEARAAGDKTGKAQSNNLMKLRTAAIHPLLFRRIYTDAIVKKMAKAAIKDPDLPGRDEELVREDMCAHTDFQMYELCLKYPTTLSKWAFKNEEWMQSGKVQKLVELLKKFRENGDRTLVFSQFTSVMDILEQVLGTLDMPFYRLDGSTPITNRQDMLDMFYQDETPVFMLSTKAGGSGINLACANKVIIFDSSFNPQEDVQAENRAHRVGQTREVEVVRLVTKDTIEEAIHALGNSKLALDDRVAGEGATKEEENQAEKDGMSFVEKMLFSTKKEEDGKKDLKDAFLQGLKSSGLDMSKA